MKPKRPAATVLAIALSTSVTSTLASVLRRAREPAAPEDEVNAFGLSESDWDGMDESLDVPPPFSNTSFANLSHTLSVPPSSMYVVAGQYNTGTNLLKKLVDLNFPTAHHYDQNLQKGLPNLHTYFWKHTKPAHIKPDLRSLMAAQNTVALVMVRDPLSWLDSMKRSPYDLKGCVHRDNWLTAPCKTPPTYLEYWAHVPQTQISLPNLQSHWSEWTKDYQHMRDFRFHNAVVIRYEDIVMDTEGQIARIGAALGIKPTEPVKQLHSSAKSHGVSNGRAAAIRKLKSKSYLNRYWRDELRQACVRFDAVLARSLQYHGDCPA